MKKDSQDYPQYMNYKVPQGTYLTQAKAAKRAKEEKSNQK